MGARPPKHPDPALVEFGARLAQALDSLPSRKVAAEIGQVSVDQLYAYMKGENQPGFQVIGRIAKAANVRLEWLAYGIGEMRGIVTEGLDRGLLTSTIDAVETVLAEERLRLEPLQKAEMILALYEISAGSGGKRVSVRPEAARAMLRLVQGGRK